MPCCSPCTFSAPSARGLGPPLPHLSREMGSPNSATSAPGLGLPRHICTATRRPAGASAPGPGSGGLVLGHLRGSVGRLAAPRKDAPRARGIASAGAVSFGAAARFRFAAGRPPAGGRACSARQDAWGAACWRGLVTAAAPWAAAAPWGRHDHGPLRPWFPTKPTGLRRSILKHRSASAALVSIAYVAQLRLVCRVRSTMAQDYSIPPRTRPPLLRDRECAC